MSIVLNYLKLQENHKNIFKLFSEVENFIFGINKLKIDQNIFICGMPRSGTTFFTHLINSSDEFSSFKYKDLPFYTIPIFWKYFSGIFYGNKIKIHRLHGDNLLIDKFSPDSFEELIWKNYLPNYSDKGYWQYLDKDYLGNIDKTLEFFMKKIIYINKKNKYLSKNNNNIFRIKYILSKFPNSKIILILRNPIDTSISLSKVHKRFLKLHNLNNEFSDELKLLGHEEFGFNRKFFNLDNINTLNYNRSNNEIKKYINKCLELNSFIVKNYMEEIKKGKIIVADFDNLMKFNDIKLLLKKLNISNIKKVEEFFNKNFKKRDLYKLKRDYFENFLKDYRILQKYSLI